MSKKVPIIITRKNEPLSRGEGQCDCDCDCACPQAPVEQSLADFRVFSEIHELEFVISEDIYLTLLQEDFYTVFNLNTNNGQVIVLNEVALWILQIFRQKLTLQDAVECAVQNGIEAHETQECISQLLQLSLLVPPGYIPKPPNSETDTLIAWLHVTNECNLRCTYCYLDKTNAPMKLEMGKKTVDAIFRSAKMNNFRAIKLKFAGGESTLNFDLVIDLFDYARAKANQDEIALNAVMLTNGVGITIRMIDEVLKRGIKVMISLDGIGPYNDVQRVFANGKGSFNIVSRSIDRLLSRGVVPDISVTVTETSIDGLPELLKFILLRNLPFSLNFYRENECSTDHTELKYSEDHMIAGMKAAYQIIEEFLPERSLLGAIVDRANFINPHNKTCGVGDSYVVIDEVGNVSKCQMAIKDIVGTVESPDILAMVRKDQLGIQNLPVLEKEGCKSCTWKYWCTGGCPLSTFRATGRYDIKSPNCNIYKELYPILIRLEGLRLLRQYQLSLPVINVSLPITKIQ